MNPEEAEANHKEALQAEEKYPEDNGNSTGKRFIDVT
jgi:hypothetical protein